MPSPNGSSSPRQPRGTAASSLYSVATRLPPEFRLTPDDAWVLLRDEVFNRLSVRDLPADEQRRCFRPLRATA